MASATCASKIHIKPGKVLTDGDVSELSNVSGFTPEQVREWYANFLKDCPSGKLNKRKFSKIYKQLYPNGKPEKYCERVFRTFDTDASGNIDFGEFLLAISITGQQDPRKKLEWTFLMYDIDHNGYIDKKELRKIIHAIYDLLGKEKLGPYSPNLKVNQIFAKMDNNTDEKLSKEEFVSGCLQDEYLRKLLAPSTT